MCDHCDYTQLLEESGIDPTPNRLRIMEIIGSNSFPLSASQIHETMSRDASVSQVTIYRILDLFVENRLVERISTGGRASYYGLAPNEHHQAHPHFYCTVCGQMDCLSPEAATLDLSGFIRNFPGRIDKFELRLDGVCKNCLKKQTNRRPG